MLRRYAPPLSGEGVCAAQAASAWAAMFRSISRFPVSQAILASGKGGFFYQIDEEGEGEAGGNFPLSRHSFAGDGGSAFGADRVSWAGACTERESGEEKLIILHEKFEWALGCAAGK